ncbi:SPT3 Dosage dependent suppressor of Ty-induced promoter mutations-like protein [Conoideocrella luteorostrata]|uniref:SPT3 Dosage dependent suppressor of Ty-induced promoter mutations-like protein n=1 Tax=Conoideocrella luteorostrata TaxID=1105319 RepID=A0AAJ0CN47_9HYPO|nr:SPT3 Dosage dependent suppressor of Ty-induced promoter mutations-like protein [Conoideocrella luteorostrata]
MPSGEFHEFSDDEFGSSNLFDFSTSPDTLQSLEVIGSNDQKSFLNPQELAATGPFPDSPNGSYHDSSSESASSSKRTRSSDSTKTPAATRESTMDTSADIKMDWGDGSFGGFPDDDNAFTFGREPDPSAMDGLYPFGEQDDSFMDSHFDFDSASSSPEGQHTGRSTLASPSMPTIKNNSPQKGAAGQCHKINNKSNNTNHKKQNSQYSVSSNGVKMSASREVSPMSAMVTSHNSSPQGTFFNSPSPLTTHVGGNTVWPNRVDVAAASAPDALPTPTQLGTAMGQPMPVSQQMPLYNNMNNNTPAFGFTGGYELRILPTPLKSRVETQIPIKMTLSPLPPGVTKLHLPTHTISKPKLLARPSPECSPDTLELYVGLVCTSAMENGDLKKKALERAASVPRDYLPDLDDEENAPQNGGDVRICNGCITRERKRAARKKIKKPDEEKVWSQDEERRVIVFNTQEVKEWQPLSGVLDASGRPDPVVPPRAMQIDAPMRIACYCRHHGEKMGFNVIFTIKDFQDRLIAQAMSNPIMITDDHKTHPMAQVSNPQVSEAVTSTTIPVHMPQPMYSNSVMPGAQNGAFQAPQPQPQPTVDNTANHGAQSPYQGSASGKTTPTMSTSTGMGRPLSRPSSPNQGGPAKKRKSSAARVPNGLTMTRLDTSPPPGSQTTSTQMSTATSPFSPNPSPFQQPEQIYGALNGQQPFANGPPTPGSTDQVPFFSNRSASMDNLAMAQLYSAPASSHPSRAPSPNGLRNSVANSMQSQFTQNLAANLYSLPLGVNQPRVPPVIHKIIPNEGPKIGGIEVTVLGAAFFQGLEVWFGEQKATTTTYWGDSSLVCLLPPSAVAGTVAVTFKHHGVPGPQMGKQPPTFKYIDDNEDKLIRTALSVLGQKMSGQMVDVSDLARRILNDGSSTWSGGGGSAGPSSGAPMFNHAATSHEHLESQLLKCLDLIDLDDSTHKTRLDLKRPTGHTMLHLACSLGYHRFVAALLARGANPDARDKGGFTPLHMAAIHNHSEIVRRLMLVGADPTIRSLSSLTPADVAQSRAVLRAIRHSERHVRSRSGGSLHSRTSSATSLRSLWQPMTRAHTHEEPIFVDPSEESPEYTSGDFEDEDPDEDHYLVMRRASTMRQEEESTEASDDESHPDGPGSPTTALAAALKDQVQQQLQQFQQSMTLHLQNLAHLPQIPALPGMTMLPDYQAYIQRVQQLMPGMSGARPGSAGPSGENQGKIDTRWWDISSYMNTSGSAPPAYEDIFPRDNMDRKEESVVRAAAEAEADTKCAALYDQPALPSTATAGTATATATTATTTTTQQDTDGSPEVLKIGRKNAITKEQQEQFLRARQIKLKSLRSDRNLFFIWIPLLLVMVCAMLYSYFPSLFPFIWTSVRAVVQAGNNRVSELIHSTRGHLVEL